MIAVDELHELAPFRDVARPVIAALAAQAADRRYAAGAILFEAGSAPRGWYVVIEGKVRVLRGNGARRHVVHTEGPGGTLGEVPLFSGGTHPATGVAAEPTRCALFSRGALEAAIEDNPAVAFALLGRLALRVRELVNRLDGRSSMSVQTRLLEFIRSRPRSPRTLAVSLGMTQQALAEELGTVRDVVARELRLLCRNGTLESLGGGRYLARDAPVETKPIR